jgi:hypothetical protein
MDTIKITTPVNKAEVELKPYLTGGDKLDLADVSEEKMKEKVEKMILIAVISVNGNKENILESVRAMHGQDFDFVMDKITTMIEGSAVEKKKKTE